MAEDGETEGQTKIQEERHIHACRHADTGAEIMTGTQILKKGDTQRNRQANRKTHTETYRQKDSQSGRQVDTQAERQGIRETNR